MLEPLSLAWRLVSASVRAQMQYRASFVMLSVGSFVQIGIEFVGIWALFDRFGSLRGWTLAEVGLLYGITHSAFAIAELAGRGFDTFPGLVKTGDFDRVLLRPRGTAFQIAWQEVQLWRVGRLTVGLAVLTWSVWRLPAPPTLGGGAVALASIAAGACIFYGLFVLQATIAFWTIDSLEVMNILTYGGTETAQFPLTIYRGWWRSLLTFVVPLAAINVLPAGQFLGREVLPGVPSWVQCSAPAIGPAFLAVCLCAWRFGVRRYASTGS